MGEGTGKGGMKAEVLQLVTIKRQKTSHSNFYYNTKQ